MHFISALLERKELDEADNWLATLEKFVPNSFETVRLRAEYLFLRGKQDEAFDLAMGFLDNPNAVPKDRGQQLALVAQVMESFADRLKASSNLVAAKKFADKAETLFGFQRSKNISAVGDIIYAATGPAKTRRRLSRRPGAVRGRLSGGKPADAGDACRPCGDGGRRAIRATGEDPA